MTKVDENIQIPHHCGHDGTKKSRPGIILNKKVLLKECSATYYVLKNFIIDSLFLFLRM
jgi:hypothetical protein